MTTTPASTGAGPRRDLKRRVRARLRELYYGHSRAARRFQAWTVGLDLLLIGFFVVTKFVAAEPWFVWANLAAAALIGLDVGAKAFATGTARRFFRYPEVWADLIVLATLLVPAMTNWAFLRILRLWALVRRERFWNTLGGGRWDDTYVEDVTRAASNLVVVVFISAGLALALFGDDHPGLNTFVDALYFAVTALTTTGFGDITFQSTEGRLFTIALMVTGIGLFVRLATTLFQPHKRRVTCKACGLSLHDNDARHCKDCGAPLPKRRT